MNVYVDCAYAKLKMHEFVAAITTLNSETGRSCAWSSTSKEDPKAYHQYGVIS